MLVLIVFVVYKNNDNKSNSFDDDCLLVGYQVSGAMNARDATRNLHRRENVVSDQG
jgi:hypothetical protein